MSPRVPSSSSPTSARSSSAPYQRRPSGQPKSSRQQFSACGACRMRRVRCDLKDLPVASAGPHPACSNCKERGLKCVDEFADVKAVKLLRRGRRLQQVEHVCPCCSQPSFSSFSRAIYGKSTDGLNSQTLASSATHLSSLIPNLTPDFFSSLFWRWFSLQRPILDSSEFAARFIQHSKGSHPLGHEGSLLAQLLVVWAASFGVDERGQIIDHDDHSFDSMSHPEYSVSARSTRSASSSVSRPMSSNVRTGRRENTEAMLREILELVDYHGILRKPSWDGIRVLLLLLPLLEDTSPLDKLAIHEATLLQARALCVLPDSSTCQSLMSNGSDEALVRARVFWYAHLQEAVTTGMRGGRLVLTEDDLDLFQGTLPPYNFNINSAPSPGSPFLTTSHPVLQVTHLFSIPLHLSRVCRKIHTCLTGAKASRKVEEGGGVDSEGIKEIWHGLQLCWEEFESVKRPSGIDNQVDGQVERFASAWQILIFECYNVIREALKRLVSRSRPGSSSPQPMFSSHSSPHSSPHDRSSPPCYVLQPLYGLATRKCRHLLPSVLGIIKHHLSCDMSDTAGMFRWDAGLIRDGCFYAGYFCANTESPSLVDWEQLSSLKQETDSRMGSLIPPVPSSYLPVYDTEEGVRLCLTALAEMRWAFSKSDDRCETILTAWDNGNMRRRSLQSFSQPQTPLSDHPNVQEIEMRFSDPSAAPHAPAFVDVYGPSGKMGSASAQHLPPLNVNNLSTSHSAPPTAYSTDSSAGAHGWPSYTPPGTSTSTSGTSNAGTSMQSPVFSSLVPNAGIKSEGMLYGHHPGDMETFNFSPPGTGDVNVMVGYHHNPHSARTVSNSFMDFSSTGPSGMSQAESLDFVDDRNGYYH